MLLTCKLWFQISSLFKKKNSYKLYKNRPDFASHLKDFHESVILGSDEHLCMLQIMFCAWKEYRCYPRSRTVFLQIMAKQEPSKCLFLPFTVNLPSGLSISSTYILRASLTSSVVGLLSCSSQMCHPSEVLATKLAFKLSKVYANFTALTSESDTFNLKFACCHELCFHQLLIDFSFSSYY